MSGQDDLADETVDLLVAAAAAGHAVVEALIEGRVREIVREEIAAHSKAVASALRGHRTLRVLVGMYSLLLTLVCVVVAIVRMQADGVLVLAAVFAAVFAWAVGACHRHFWVD